MQRASKTLNTYFIKNVTPNSGLEVPGLTYDEKRQRSIGQTSFSSFENSGTDYLGFSPGDKRACDVHGGELTQAPGPPGRWYCKMPLRQCPAGTTNGLNGVMFCFCENDSNKPVPFHASPIDINNICVAPGEKKACKERGGEVTQALRPPGQWHCKMPQCPHGTIGSLSSEGGRMSCACKSDHTKKVPLNTLPDEVNNICSRQNQENCERLDDEGDAEWCTEENAFANESSCPYLTCFLKYVIYQNTQKALFKANQLAEENLKTRLNQAKYNAIISCNEAYKTYKLECSRTPSPPQSNGNRVSGRASELCRRAKQEAERNLEIDTALVNKCLGSYVNFFGSCSLDVTETGVGSATFGSGATEVFKETSVKYTQKIDKNYHKTNEVEAINNRVIRRSQLLETELGRIQNEAAKCIVAFGEGPKKEDSHTLSSGEEVLKELAKEVVERGGEKGLSGELGEGRGVETDYNNSYAGGESVRSLSGTNNLNSEFKESSSGYKKSNQPTVSKIFDSRLPASQNYGRKKVLKEIPALKAIQALIFKELRDSDKKMSKLEKERYRIDFDARKFFNGYKNLKPYFSNPKIFIDKKDRAIYGRKRLTERLNKAQDKLGKDIPLIFIDGKFVPIDLAEQTERRRLARNLAVEARKRGKTLMVLPSGKIITDINPDMTADIFKQINYGYRTYMPEKASSYDFDKIKTQYGW